MDASKLTQMRREAANQWIHTTDTVDASDTTRKRKLQQSQFFFSNINAAPTICYTPLVDGCNYAPRPVPNNRDSGQVKSYSYDDIMFRNAGVATCCNASSKPIIMGVSSAWYRNASDCGYQIPANSSFGSCEPNFNATPFTIARIVNGLPSTTCLTDYYNRGKA
jgi:hypothetical protein|uniref:Uncharacterized protein n=1 Tax=viral metagenome TaxID=1070528 RepID=A0A6C0BGU8_9ZZZZ